MKSMFAKFKLAEVFSDIDRAQRESLFEQTIKFSSKITFTFELLKNLKKEGHRVLIFSMSKKILNIFE
jgi:SNF2 family DNA or RNA helicase